MNRFAVSSSGLAEIMQRSSAALASAGNTIDQSLGLAVGGNSVIQDPAKVGTALKTLSLRLTKTKAEIEELGEDSDGAASSVSELRDTLLALTNQKVDILDGDSYKSTYDILKEMAAVWDDMSQMNRQGALFAMAGMNHGNTLASIIANFKDVEAAYQVSLNESFGSADRENAKFLNSIEGRMQQFQSSMQQLSSHTFSSDFLKGFISAGQGVVDILDQMAQSGTLIPGIIAGITGALAGFKNIGVMQLRDWSKGFWNSDGKGINKVNWKNIEWAGTGYAIGDKKTATNYNNILSNVFGSSSQPWLSKMSFGGKDADFLEALNRNLLNAKDSSKSFGEVFRGAITAAKNETGHLSTQVVALTSKMNNFKANKDVAMKDMSEVKVVQGANAQQATQMGSSFGKNLLTGFTSAVGNIGISFLASWGISKLIETIDYAMHYSENKIAEGQAVVDKYKDAVEAATTQKEKLEAYKPEFSSLSSGVDDLGRNISLSTEEYDRYKQIVADVVSVSPSLIASYDAEGNALANKNGLLEEAIKLEEKKIDLARQERLDDSFTEFEGYKNQLKDAQSDAYESVRKFKAEMKDLNSSSRWKFGEDILSPEVLNIVRDHSSKLDASQIEVIEKELKRLDEMALNPDIDIDLTDVERLRSALNSVIALQGEVDRIDNQVADDLALNAAHATTFYQTASSEQQAYIDKIVAGLATVSGYSDDSLKAMGENVAKIFKIGFDTQLLSDVDSLVEKFNTGNISAEEFSGSVSDLASRISTELTNANILKPDGSVFTTEDIYKALGINEIMTAYEGMMARVDDFSNRYKGKLDFSELTEVGDIRLVTDVITKLESALGTPLPNTLLESINQQITGSKDNLQEVMDVYSTLADMSFEGHWSTTDLERVFSSLDGMNVSDMKQYVEGFATLNEMIETLGYNIDNIEDQSKISDMFSAFIDGNYSTKFGQLNEQFQHGKVDAAGFDASVKDLLTTFAESAGIEFETPKELEDFFANFTKSVNVDQMLSTLREAKTAVDDFFDADYSLRPFLTDSLDAASESLENLKNQARAAHDVQTFFNASMMSDYVGRVSQISSDPYERLSSAIQTATAAMNEQNATGRVSYETFKNLQALGPDYANTLKATSGQLLVNKDALLQVVDAEKKQSETMLSNLQNGALQEYARLGDQIQKIKQEMASGDTTNAFKLEGLEKERQDMLWLADSYKAAKAALNELTGARAQLDSFLGQTSAADDFTNSWGKGLQDKLQGYVDSGQWGEVKKGLSTVFNDVPSDIPGLKALMAKLKSYGTEAKDIIANIGKEIGKVTNGEDWKGLSHFDLDTGEFVLFEEELEALSQKTGFTTDYILQAFQALSSYDLTFNTDNLSQCIDRLHQIDGALSETEQGMVANVDKIREALSGTWSDSDINSLIVALQEAGYTLQTDSGEAVRLTEELTKLSNVDGLDADKFDIDVNLTGAAEAGATLNVAATSAEKFADAVSEVDGTKRVEITGLTDSAEGAKMARTEIAALVGSFDHEGYELTINGQVVGLDEALNYLDELGVTYGDVRQQILETPIDISTPEGLEEFASSIGQTTEGMEGFKDLAKQLGDTKVTARFESEGDIEDVQAALQQCAGDAEALQNALNNLAGATMPANAWGIADTSGVFDEVSGKIDEVQGKLNTLGETQISIDLSGLISSLDGVSSSASNAAGSVNSLKSAINSLPTKKNITITTNYVTKGTPATKNATGTSYAKPGMSLVNDGSPVNGSAAELIIRKRTGEAFIANDGKLAMVQLYAGDKVLNAAQTQATLREHDIKIPRFVSGNFLAGSGGGGGSKKKPTTTSNRGSTSSSSSSSRSSSNSSSSSSSAAEDAKSETDAIKEEFEKLYKELQHLRAMDQISEKEYLKRLEVLYKQYLSGREDLLDDYRKYEEEVYKGLKAEQEKEWSRSLSNLKHQLDMHKITEEQYFKDLKGMNEDYYGGKEEYLDEYQANELAIHNYERQKEDEAYDQIESLRKRGLISDEEAWRRKSEFANAHYKNIIGREKEWQKFLEEEHEHELERQDKEYRQIEHLSKLNKITQQEAWAMRDQFAAKNLVGVNGREDDLMQYQEDRHDYEHDQFEKHFDDIDIQVEFGLISKTQGLEAKAQLLKEALDKNTISHEEYEKGIYDLYRDKTSYANEQIDRAQQAVANAFSRRQTQLEREKADKARPLELKIREESDIVYEIQRELDDYNFEIEVSLRPLEYEKWDLEQEEDRISREYELKLRPKQKELQAKQRLQSDLQNEQELTLRPIEQELDSLQRQADNISHEYGERLKPLQDLQRTWQRQQSLIQHEQELAMRPIDKEINALNREVTHINRYYELLLRPFKKFQKEQQKELDLLQRQQELALRPIEKQLNALSRDTTHVNHDYDMMLRPLQEQLELLQDAQDTVQDTYDIEEKRYNLTKAMTERNRLVYKEGRGFVYEANQESIKAAEKALQTDVDQNQIKELQKQIKQIERERDKILEGISDAQYYLTEEKLDIEESYSALMEPISDALYDVGKLIEYYQDIQEEILEPIEDRLYDLNEKRLDLSELYEAQLESISDALFELNLQIEDIEVERDEILYEIEDKMFHLTQKRLDIEKVYEEQLFQIAQAIFQLTRDIEMMEQERDDLLEPIHDRLYTINHDIEQIKHTQELHNTAVNDELRLHNRIIEDLEREKTLSDRWYEDQMYALDIVKRKWDDITDPIEEAANNMAAMNQFGASFQTLLGMINSNELPQMVQQATVLSALMAGIVEKTMQAINPDPTNPGLTNITDKWANVDKYLGITGNAPTVTTPTVTPPTGSSGISGSGSSSVGSGSSSSQTRYQYFQDRLNAILKLGSKFTGGDYWDSGINIKTFQKFVELAQAFENGDSRAGEALEQFIQIITPVLEAYEAYAQNPTGAKPVFEHKDWNLYKPGSSDSFNNVTVGGSNNTVVIGGNNSSTITTPPSSGSSSVDQVTEFEYTLERAKVYLTWLKDLQSTSQNLGNMTQADEYAKRVAQLNKYIYNASLNKELHGPALQKYLNELQADYPNIEAKELDRLSIEEYYRKLSSLQQAAEANGNTIAKEEYERLRRELVEVFFNKSLDEASYKRSLQALFAKIEDYLTQASQPSAPVPTPTAPIPAPSEPAPPTSVVTPTKPDKPSDVTVDEIDPAVIDAFVTRFSQALANKLPGQAGAPIDLATLSKISKIGKSLKDGDGKYSLSDWLYYFRLYDNWLPHYASGRKTGRSELAITQESGPELLASRSNGRYTMLNAGDMVFSNAQTKRLWTLSKVDPASLISAGLGIPNIQTHSTEVSTCTINIGDIIVQHADDPESLSNAIINRLPNQLLQDLKVR